MAVPSLRACLRVLWTETLGTFPTRARLLSSRTVKAGARSAHQEHKKRRPRPLPGKSRSLRCPPHGAAFPTAEAEWPSPDRQTCLEDGHFHHLHGGVFLPF